MQKVINNNWFHCGKCGHLVKRTEAWFDPKTKKQVHYACLSSKGGLRLMHWEHCKRSTRCRGCGKIMEKGDVRLAVMVYGYHRKFWYYRCQACGQFYLSDRQDELKNTAGVLEELKKDVIETLTLPLRPLRLLRPIE
jgi:hypothetical protein